MRKYILPTALAIVFLAPFASCDRKDGAESVNKGRGRVSRLIDIGFDRLTELKIYTLSKLGIYEGPTSKREINVLTYPQEFRERPIAVDPPVVRRE